MLKYNKVERRWVGFMFKFMFKYFMVIALVFNFLLLADDGDKKVKLLGNLKEGSVKSISAKELEKSMKTSTFTLYNPWEKRTESYEGVLINEFVAHFGNGTNEKLKLIAIDDYEVTFDKKMWLSERILLVTKVDGKYISIKEKGPMKIVFVDYDQGKKEYELNLPLWMWMINKIELK